MLDNFRDMHRILKQGEPGRRFILYHDRQRRQDGKLFWHRVARLVLGFVLVVVGLLLSLPPGVPGFFLYIPGAVLIAGQLRIVALALDRMECAVRRLRKRVGKAQRG